VTTSRPRPSKGEVRRGVALLCAEGGEEETEGSLEEVEGQKVVARRRPKR